MASAFIVILVVLASLTIPLDCFHDNHQYHPPKSSAAFFVFGDSFFDPGNNNYINTTTDFQANFPPYGESFFKYPTGRFSDGRTIPDFIAEYANLPLLPPYLEPASYGHDQWLDYGANFASGGAGALAETYEGFVVSLKMQLRNFEKVEKQLRLDIGEKGANGLVSNAVYLFSIGTNDCVTPSSVFNSYAPEDYASMVIGNISAVFKEIYKKGGRKFAIINLGPLGCFPGFRAANESAGGNGECFEQVTALAKLNNLLLAEKLVQLEKHLRGFKYSYFDFFSVAVDIFAYPSKYGFKEVKSACCGGGPYRGAFSCGGKREIKEYEVCDDPQDYFLFDCNHPTQAAYQMLAEMMWAGPPNVTGPYNLKSLFSSCEFAWSRDS
ncbi:hypothetical protein ACH5RR_024291 [Cinchona calisaya]|uniref:GDSL esterase/lipase 1-like n=1 Tax=Cinchona calisaya TaxID=153742 RepID=A0ABD2YW78_9GENT